MTKVPIEKTESNKENEFQLINVKFKPRRTTSFLTTGRKRATQYCTLTKLKKNRRLSLNQPSKKTIQANLSKLEKTSTENSISLASIKSQLKKYADEFKSNDTVKAIAAKKPSFKLMKTKHNIMNDLNIETLFSYDQPLKDYISNQSNSKNDHQNEELNNKIDLEIRILDGILKLLNAICSTSNIISNSTQSTLNSSLITSSITTTSANSSASALISSLDNVKFDDSNKCSTLGAAIAAAMISNRSSNDSTQSTSDNISFDPSIPEYNHVMQILTACKCLFVSHRKIAIYLQNLHDLEKKSLGKNKHLVLTENQNLSVKEFDNKSHYDSISSALDISTSSAKSNSSILNGHKPSWNANKSLNGDTSKIILSDIRIPLSWKWTDYLKASKNSENINSKFATFAIIYSENMIYDTQLLSNIDASVTDISFSESFVFDDVKPNKFEIFIEIYAYELYNITNNILQSARKLAKQFSDFATFKRNTLNQSGSNQQNMLSQMPNLFNNALSNSTNNHSYSMHKFKLIAKTTLTQNDLNDDIQTRCLQLVNESNFDQLNTTTSSNSNAQNNQNTISSISASNKLALFDYYCCRLKLLPS